MNMEYYALASIFILAFAIETVVTGKVFLHREAISQSMNRVMKWRGVGSLAMISAINLLGLVWLNHNMEYLGAPDRGNYVQAAFAITTSSLFLWVITFHAKVLSKK